MQLDCCFPATIFRPFPHGRVLLKKSLVYSGWRLGRIPFQDCHPRSEGQKRSLVSLQSITTRLLICGPPHPRVPPRSIRDSLLKERKVFRLQEMFRKDRRTHCERVRWNPRRGTESPCPNSFPAQTDTSRLSISESRQNCGRQASLLSPNRAPPKYNRSTWPICPVSIFHCRRTSLCECAYFR